ncbi:MAG: hypothetical protein GY754_13070, partial [bacterium]|nr:hypothetical protein [bacterium]
MKASITNETMLIQPAIEPAKKKEYYPATAAQRRLFLLHEIEENHTAYSTTARITFRGSVNADRLEQGFKTLMF